MHFLMRKPNPSSENGNVTTFCSGRRFFDVFSVSWKFYRENFLRTTLIRNLLIKAHLLNYYMGYFWPRWKNRSFRRDATATRMTKYWNSLNRSKRSLIPPLIIPETCRLIQDIASRTPLAFPRFLETLCLKIHFLLSFIPKKRASKIGRFLDATSQTTHHRAADQTERLSGSLTEEAREHGCGSFWSDAVLRFRALLWV